MPPSADSSASSSSSSAPRDRAPSRWNGLSTEERQRERRQLLIEAAFELLATEGTTGTTVRAVCSHARLNPRYFYESFDDLDELVVAVFIDVARQLQRRVTEATATAGDSVADAVHAAVGATVRFIDEDRRRGQIIYIESLGNVALNRHRVTSGQDLIDLVRRDTVRRGGSRGSQQRDHLAAALLVGGFHEMMIAWLTDRVELDADELIAHATELFITAVEAAEDVSLS